MQAANENDDARITSSARELTSSERAEEDARNEFKKLMNLNLFYEEDRNKFEQKQERFLRIIESYPHFAKDLWGSDNLSPFHQAAGCSTSIAVVSVVFHAYPEAAKRKTPTGWTPLHFACRYNRSEGVIMKLILLLTDEYPESINAKDIGGMTPLHLASQYVQSDRVIRLLIQMYPQAIKAQDNDGMIALHYACLENHSQVIRLLVKNITFPDAINWKSNDGRAPLHFACANELSGEGIIRLLLEGYPDAAMLKDIHGWTPLHLACRHNESEQVVRLLLKECPEIATLETNEGWTPLHLACTHDCSERHAWSERVIQLLLDEYPAAATLQNHEGLTPLHLACRFNQSYQVIRSLLEEHPESIKAKDTFGRTALHFACFKSGSQNMIELLVKKYPEAVNLTNKYDGKTPLEYAREKNAAHGVIMMLTNATQEQADKRESVNGLMAEAAMFISQGNHAAALVKLEAAAEIDPSQIQVWAGIASCHRELFRFDDMAIAAKRCIQANHTVARGHYLLAVARSKLGNASGALKAAEAGLDQDPHDESLVDLKSTLEEANELQERCATTESFVFELSDRLDRCEITQGEFVEAVSQFKKKKRKGMKRH